ncbi:hypothetical protein CRM22_003382 [Opisthorchis felineus]|uniref:MD-2-related lipid-recognition domain-containing protein n=1 Tax=Opisthorchis felineus TaxID=147828 RepID=A0A4S2M7L5_OPIFE|nr:hypothetical protein CRM22_003382 [Opisthorchis felineus]
MRKCTLKLENSSVGATVSSVFIAPCNEDPCVLFRNTPASIRIEFRAVIDIDATRSTALGSFGNERMRVTLPTNGVCGRVNPSCLLRAGETYNYIFNAMVPGGVRRGPMLVRWELLKRNGQMFLCFDFVVMIQ